jgi:prepilin-type processing-associated H-X9-DG protein
LAAATSGALDGAPAGKKLRRCTRCKAAWFCADSSCQRLGWLAHKAACDQAAAAATARCTSAAAAAAARAAKAQGPGRREVSCQADAEAAWAAHRELGRRTEAANALFLGGHVREALNAYEAAASAAADAASLAAAAAELAADKYAAAAAQAARAAADACFLLQVRHYRLCCPTRAALVEAFPPFFDHVPPARWTACAWPAAATAACATRPRPTGR